MLRLLAAAPQPAVPTSLQIKLLQLQIEQLRISNEQSRSWVRQLLSDAPLLTALAGIIAITITWIKFLSERAQQRSDHLDEEFAKVVESLGSEVTGARVGAAAILPTYIDRSMIGERSVTVRLIAAHLAIPQHDSVRGLLTGDLRHAVLARTRAATWRDDPHSRVVDLSAVNAPGLDLSGALLEGATFRSVGAQLLGARLDGLDLWRAEMSNCVLTEASLRSCNLGQSKLAGVTARRAVFNGSQMTSISLRGSDLRESLFRGCALQSAHFDGCDLRGARFEGANLKDAYFLSAELDTDALKSLSRCKNWQDAHLEQRDVDRISAFQ